MAVLPDVTDYYNMFDDYLDFSIHPWDEHGFDEGVMLPERKAALRYLTLAMNIYKGDPAMLPANFLDFMSEYQKTEYQEPESMTTRKKKGPKYSDLRNQAKAQQQEGVDSTSGLSSKELQGFDMSARRGAKTYDVIEKKSTYLVGQGKMGPIYKDVSTRSVFFDAPGEDSISPETWDWKRYAPQDDLVEKHEKKKKTKKK